MDKEFQPRVIGGQLKGRRILVPPMARPVTDRMKQSLFDRLMPQLPGAVVLDLYAGSGSFGIEALSRGAKHCTFVDNDPEAISVINRNLVKFQITEQSNVVEMNAGRFIKESKLKFDIIFVDKPYSDLEDFELHKFGRLMHESSRLILKFPSSKHLPDLVTMPTLHEAKYGANRIFIVGKKDPV